MIYLSLYSLLYEHIHCDRFLSFIRLFLVFGRVFFQHLLALRWMHVICRIEVVDCVVEVVAPEYLDPGPKEVLYQRRFAVHPCQHLSPSDMMLLEVRLLLSSYSGVSSYCTRKNLRGLIMRYYAIRN